MRIAIVSWNRRNIGGTEEYLEGIIASLCDAGHNLAFWHGVDEPNTVRQISLPPETPAWCVSEMGEQNALAALRSWSPDVIYAHGLKSPPLEAEVLKIAPAVFFAHNYYGTCISGGKTFTFPDVRPCDLRFSRKCLAHYYPHRCGGLNPVTLWKDYKRQSLRLSLLPQYRAIVTISGHMADEYINNGFDPARVHNLSSYINRENSTEAFETTASRIDPTSTDFPNDGFIHLLFLGRMDYLKGGHVLCAALPQVLKTLKRPIKVTFAGDGPRRKLWELSATRLNEANDALQIDFVGWVSAKQKDDLLKSCHLLVVPSLWPEPFGMVGLEAGCRSLPVVAFDVGGIGEWLWDGVNGFLASGTPPTAPGLAAAIARIFESPSRYLELRRGAWKVSKSFNQQMHVKSLIRVFDRAVAEH